MKIEQVLPRQLYRTEQGRTGVPVLAEVTLRILLLAGMTFALGRAAIPAQTARINAFSLAVAGHGFNLLEWEVTSLSDKVEAYVQRPAATFSDAEGANAVHAYLARANRIGAIEGTLQRHASAKPVAREDSAKPGTQDAPISSLSHAELMQLRAELHRLRTHQAVMRPAVEQIIQKQVGSVLLAAGFGWEGRILPPVQFAFTEPPKKLIVSRRDRIETIYSRMLDAEISLEEIEAAEAAIEEHPNTSAFITNIGGLGAFPTMVVDRARLLWILSTVAHEWVHNYLIFHPLGWHYFASQDLTTMNETVAEIVGNDIGMRALVRYYPEMVTPPTQPQPPDDEEPPAARLTEEESQDAPEQEAAQPDEAPEPVDDQIPPEDVEPEFDFGAEMRETRLKVDELLADGQVAAAEAYMEERRRVFVANGYPLRVLNQAYFAFNGSYVTSPSSTSPIGPKMTALAEHFNDLRVFMQTVRSYTSAEDLEASLNMYGVEVELN